MTVLRCQPPVAAAEALPAAPMVFIVDDDADVRSGLLNLFASAGYAAEAHADIAGFLLRWPASASAAPSCLLLDVRFPDGDGFSLLTELRQRGIGLPVIMMSGHGDVAMTVRAMKGGAIDFLAKPMVEAELLCAIGAALQRDCQRREAEQASRALAQRYATLTMREREIMLMVAQGLMNKQIAGQVGTSEITVKIQRGRAMRKMQARSVAELTRMAGALRLGCVGGAAPAICGAAPERQN